MIILILGCPVVGIPLSAALVDTQGMQGSRFGTSSAGAAGRKARLTSNHLRGSNLDFPLRFTPIDHLPIKANEQGLPSTICQ